MVGLLGLFEIYKGISPTLNYASTQFFGGCSLFMVRLYPIKHGIVRGL